MNDFVKETGSLPSQPFLAAAPTREHMEEQMHALLSANYAEIIAKKKMELIQNTRLPSRPSARAYSRLQAREAELTQIAEAQHRLLEQQMALRKQRMERGLPVRELDARVYDLSPAVLSHRQPPYEGQWISPGATSASVDLAAGKCRSAATAAEGDDGCAAGMYFRFYSGDYGGRCRLVAIIDYAAFWYAIAGPTVAEFGGSCLLSVYSDPGQLHLDADTNVTPTVRLNLSSYEHGSDFLSGSTAGATYDFEVKPNSEYYCWVQVYTWAHAEHDGYATGSIEITVPMLFLEAVKTG